MPPARNHSPRSALRLVATFEALKGLVVLAGACGLLTLMHRDVYAMALRLIAHTHLNPASRYPQIFLDAASNVQDSRLLVLALGAAMYSVVRLVEAYGLFKERTWAEVLAAGSGAIYLPFEVVAMAKNASPLSALLLLANTFVVAVMVHALLRRRRAAAKTAA